MMLPKLFTYDSKGKAREWSVRTEGAQVIVSHGLVGGKITEKVTTSKAKNIGKVNETTPEEQAILEAKSKWTFQIEREDYHEDIEMSGKQLRPMLALDYLKVPHRVKWEDALSQPKLDGLRLVSGFRYIDMRSDEFEMMTRKGESYKVPHLIEPCIELLGIVNQLVDGKCLALDGEAYIHGMPLQKITSLARKYQKGKTEQLEFHLFDLVIPDMSFGERYKVLSKALGQFRQLNPDVKVFDIVPTHTISPKTLDETQGRYMKSGYEGLMIRHKSSRYGIAQRSPDLFKYKQFFDDEFRIIDVWEDLNGNAMFKCETTIGQKLSSEDHIVEHSLTFDVTPKRTHDERKEMLNNRESYIGSWLTVKYQALTIDKLPQFPVGLAIRECDDSGSPLV